MKINRAVGKYLITDISSYRCPNKHPFKRDIAPLTLLI
jgi:hypothetical protein